MQSEHIRQRIAHSSAASCIWSSAASCLTTITPPACCRGSSRTARSACCGTHEGRGGDRHRHLRRGYRKEQDAGRSGHHLRRGRAAAHRRVPRAGAAMWAAWSSPSTPASPRPTPSSARLESLGVQGIPPLSHCGISLRRGSHGVSDEGLGRNEYIETSRCAGGGHRARPRQRQDGHLPVPAVP